ncbi:MAG: hypothetical protein AAGN35_15290 [Bacteroidota bacterium]
MGKIQRRRYDLEAFTSPTQTVKEDFELDKHVTRVRGILLTSDRDDQLYHRATVQILINGEEVIPDEYHAKLLMSGLGVAPKDRYLPLDLEPGNGIVKVAVTDNENPALAFSAYTVSVYLETIIEQ